MPIEIEKRPESKDRRIMTKFYEFRSFRMLSKNNLKRKCNSLTIGERRHRIFSSQQPSADILQSQCSDKFHKTHKKIPVVESFYFNLLVNFFKKEIPPALFYCEFCKHFNRNFLIEQLRVTASLVSEVT